MLFFLMIRKAVICYYIVCYSSLYTVLRKPCSILVPRQYYWDNTSRNIKKIISFRGFVVALLALKVEYVLEGHKNTPNLLSIYATIQCKNEHYMQWTGKRTEYKGTPMFTLFKYLCNPIRNQMKIIYKHVQEVFASNLLILFKTLNTDAIFFFFFIFSFVLIVDTRYHN